MTGRTRTGQDNDLTPLERGTEAGAGPETLGTGASPGGEPEIDPGSQRATNDDDILVAGTPQPHLLGHVRGQHEAAGVAFAPVKYAESAAKIRCLIE
jgi:hypothetical protein